MADQAKGQPLRVLVVEDSPDDAYLVLRELTRGGYDVTHQRVETEASMRAALRDGTWDLVLSDYGLPSFSGPEALRTLQSSGLDLPFIIVSGTVGEETAISALKSGAHDFILKGSFARLLPAVERELRDAANRAQQRDLTERLHQSQKVELLGQLAGGVAHDFNNILTAILGFCELLRDSFPPDTPQAADLAEIQRAGERAAGLTRQLLAFSRKQVIQPKVHELNALVKGLEPMLRRLMLENIDLKIELASDAGQIRIDATQIEQILINLVVNARDAMPRGGQLRVVTSKSADDLPGRYAILKVSDSGTGMAAETLEHIFEPFFTTKGPGQGTGLGLSTVATIVKQHGGEIQVQSVPGQGTTFVILLPHVVEAHGHSDAAVDDAELQGSETLLLVEDDPAVRRLASAVLVRSGYRVLEAANPRDALRLAETQAEPIHLLLSDVILPESDGDPLIERMRESRPGLLLLYMSGLAHEAIFRHGALDEGAPFLQKPFTPQALLNKVRGILDHTPTV
jgi:two-component system cell cycle sensor histidine kinase/response regulator CckA